MEHHTQFKETGLTLDIARHFYSPDVIKRFIDTISDSGGKFLHLHFSDHENYALESSYLNQLEKDARVENGIYYNPKTNKPFLTYKQIGEIIYYAKDRHIELVPEIGSPNHMSAIFTLLENEYGKDYVKNLKSKIDGNEIDITNLESVEVIKTLIAEVIYIFGHSSNHIHIGGDEFGYNIENNYEFINYVNTLNQFINSKGKVTRMWNDGLIKTNLDKLSKNIEITYWSYDGDVQERNNIEYRRKIRASLPDLLAKGFKVLNYNSYYLYFIPADNSNVSYDSEYATNDILNHWELGLWDGQNRDSIIQNNENIIGSSLSIWGEHSGNLSGEVIQSSIKELFKSVVKKTTEQKGN